MDTPRHTPGPTPTVGDGRVDGLAAGDGEAPIVASRLPHARLDRSQRGRLIAALGECCVEKGFGGTTVGDIVARAGVSRKTFYEIFRDREDCLQGALNALLGETITAATAQYTADKPLFAVVGDAIAALCDLFGERPGLAHLALVEARTASPRTQELYATGVRTLTSLLDQLRGDALPGTGELVPSDAARGAIGGAEALMREAVVQGRPERLPELVPAILYGCLVSFLGQDEALARAASAKAAGRAPGAGC